jgi:hypothetical protein
MAESGRSQEGREWRVNVGVGGWGERLDCGGWRTALFYGDQGSARRV